MNYHTGRYEHSCCPKRSWFCFKPLGLGVSASNPCLSWLCVRLKKSTFFSRVSALKTQNRKIMIWCKRQIISQKTTVQYIANLDFCLFSQPSPPFFEINLPPPLLATRTPWRISSIGPVRWGECQATNRNVVWIHHLCLYAALSRRWNLDFRRDLGRRLAGNEWLERPSVFPARMVQIQIENRLGAMR